MLVSWVLVGTGLFLTPSTISAISQRLRNVIQVGYNTIFNDAQHGSSSDIHSGTLFGGEAGLTLCYLDYLDIPVSFLSLSLPPLLSLGLKETHY